MRKLLLTTILALTPAMAMADETISGSWLADNIGHGVMIQMDIIADGHWRSQTIQNRKTVKDLWGTYEQTKKTPTTGEIVFTPLKAQADASQGEVVIERDAYVLKNNGNELDLTTGGQTMVFKQQAR